MNLPQFRKAWWSPAQAAAWIATRDMGLVAAIADYEAAPPLRAGGRKVHPGLVLAARLGLLRSFARAPDALPGGKELTGAYDAVAAAIVAGIVRENKQGGVMAADVKKLAPSTEGRGKGHRAKTHAPRVKVLPLMAHLLSTDPAPKETRASLRRWCEAQGLSNKDEMFQTLVAVALREAEHEAHLLNAGTERVMAWRAIVYRRSLQRKNDSVRRSA